MSIPKTLATGAATALLLAAAPAWAGGSPQSFGVGAEYTLAGLGGLSLNYDAGDFHAGAFLGYYDDVGGPAGDWDLDLGGRFFWHAHSTAMSDFGVGGQIGLQLQNDLPGDEDATIVTLDLGAQIRTFLAANVALSTTIGMTIITADGDGAALTGNIVGSGGIHYYF